MTASLDWLYHLNLLDVGIEVATVLAMACVVRRTRWSQSFMLALLAAEYEAERRASHLNGDNFKKSETCSVLGCWAERRFRGNISPQKEGNILLGSPKIIQNMF